jgi:hypothetical protein
MPNRENLSGRSTRANQDGASDAAGWVLIAFCVFGFAATVFFISLSSAMSQAASG